MYLGLVSEGRLQPQAHATDDGGSSIGEGLSRQAPLDRHMA